jgi:hypothetical protein
MHLTEFSFGVEIIIILIKVLFMLSRMDFLFLFFIAGSHYIAKASLELVILLPQPPQCWDCWFIMLFFFLWD